jgi:hypothetical protein
VGIALFFGETQTAAELLKHADQALYQAKAAGRNQAVVYTNQPWLRQRSLLPSLCHGGSIWKRNHSTGLKARF